MPQMLHQVIIRYIAIIYHIIPFGFVQIALRIDTFESAYILVKLDGKYVALLRVINIA